MVVEIKGKYKGNLRVELTHMPSGSVIETDAPIDNNGKGEKFSPTDLAASALGTCMLTVMGIVAERDGVKFNETSFRLEKHMATDMPRRIKKIILEIQMPKGLTDIQKKKLEKTAATCPVHHSLHPSIEMDIQFIY